MVIEGHEHQTREREKRRMATITPIETLYAGCRFRSRLEARWAVFFDSLNIKWEYEPQGYTVGKDKQPYLPDFRLPELDAFVDVKLLADLTRSGKELFTLVLGGIPAKSRSFPAHALFMPSFDFRDGSEPSRSSIASPAFAALEKLDNEDAAAVRKLIAFESRLRIVCSPAIFLCSKGKWSFSPVGIPFIEWTAAELLAPGYGVSLAPPKLVAAYDAARQARFEHGERG